MWGGWHCSASCRAPPGWCQDNPYVYVKMSLAVPWTLYFVFLGAVLIPFLVMIALAWRGRTQDTPGNDSPAAVRMFRVQGLKTGTGKN